MKDWSEAWKKIDERSLNYHLLQWESPKSSTLDFFERAEGHFATAEKVLDLAGGAGAPASYFAENLPNTNFVCSDQAKELLEVGSTLAAEKNIANLKFREIDLFNIELGEDESYDGVICLQTLSWLPSYEQAMMEIFTKVSPNWVGITSLFYDGPITCITSVHEHFRDRVSFYNTYSLPEFSKYCESAGYKIALAKPFEINIDLAKPDDNTMGTYTELVQREDGITRLQLSGPLLMNWYTVILEKI